MTEAERNEFERQRILAEQRLRDMYTVSGERLPTPPNTPPMPPFLRPPENKHSSQAHSPSLSSEKTHISNHSAISNQHTPNRSQHPSRPQILGKSSPTKGFDLLSLLNFKNFELDSDRVIILAMALLLSTEKMDEMLMLALLYIML